MTMVYDLLFQFGNLASSHPITGAHPDLSVMVLFPDVKICLEVNWVVLEGKTCQKVPITFAGANETVAVVQTIYLMPRHYAPLRYFSSVLRNFSLVLRVLYSLNAAIELTDIFVHIKDKLNKINILI